jgi:hypothetical protein
VTDSLGSSTISSTFFYVLAAEAIRNGRCLALD